MENNYSVYQHVTPDGMYYFGATNNPKKRWEGNGCHYKTTALQPYIEKYGWDNIKHIVLFKDQTRENALWIEDFLITTAQEDGVCINQRRSGLVSKEEGYRQEYYEINKEQVLERQREYQDEHKDKIREYHEQYYQKNREKELEQSRQRYQKNRDKILEQRQQRYQKNREKELEQSRQRYQRKKQEK